MRFFLLVLLCCLVPINVSGQTEIYVHWSHPLASDSNDGFSKSLPKKTIPSIIGPGVIVNVIGYYDIPIHIEFQGTPSASAIVRGEINGGTEIYQPWSINGTYGVIEHLRFLNRDNNITGELALIGPSDNIIIRDNEISGNLVSGGLYIGSAPPFETEVVRNTLVLRNKVFSNGDVNATFDQDNHGIQVGPYVENLWIRENDLYNNSGDGLQINAGSLVLQDTLKKVFVIGNRAWGNRQTGLWVKQAVDVVFINNKVWDHRPSLGSSLGVCIGGQYAPSWVWFIHNELSNCEYGIQLASDSGLGNGTESFFIGNIIYNIHDSDSSRNELDFWQECGISLPGGVNRHIINNTISDVDSGVCIPGFGSQGSLDLFHNIIEGQVANGFSLMIEDPLIVNSSIGAIGNVFSPMYRTNLEGVITETNPLPPTPAPSNIIVSDVNWVNSSIGDFRLEINSLAINRGMTVIPDVYTIFQSRYGWSIQHDKHGTQLPLGFNWDSGALEKQ